MIPSLKMEPLTFACLSSHFMADDKKLKLKEVTQGDVFTSQAAKKVNTGLTHYECLSNQHKV